MRYLIGIIAVAASLVAAPVAQADNFWDHICQNPAFAVDPVAGLPVGIRANNHKCEDAQNPADYNGTPDGEEEVPEP